MFWILSDDVGSFAMYLRILLHWCFLSISVYLSLCLYLPVSLSHFSFQMQGDLLKKIRKNKRSLKVIYLLLIYTDNLLRYFPAILGVHIPTDKIMVSPCFSKFLHSSYSLTSKNFVVLAVPTDTHLDQEPTISQGLNSFLSETEHL